MRTIWSKVRALLLLVGFIAGCSSAPVGPGPGAAFVTPSSRGFDGSQAKVDLLARSFLVRGKQAEHGYAFYAYLLFGDNGTTSAQARRAAAAAYLDLFRDATTAPASVSRHEMALFYAPVNSDADALALQKSRSPRDLLARYDYDRARLLGNGIRRSGVQLPRVAIVAHHRALREGTSVDPQQFFVVDLDLPEDRTIEQRVLAFQDALESGKAELGAGEPVVLRKARSFFCMVGHTLASLTSLASGNANASSDSPCS